MRAATFTPGPWTFKATAGDHDFSVYPESTGRDVALVRDFNEANARLIAAAPALYEALRDVLRIARAASNGIPGNRVRIERAIAVLRDVDPYYMQGVTAQGGQVSAQAINAAYRELAKHEARCRKCRRAGRGLCRRGLRLLATARAKEAAK